MSVGRGVWMFILILTAVGASILFAAVRLHQPSSPATPSTVLVFDLPTEIEEAERPFSPFALDELRHDHMTLYQAVTGIRRAAEDPHVEAMVLHIDELDWGWAKLAEFRDALLEFRDAGKPVYASLTDASDSEYFLASAASWISMPPAATLWMDGLSESVMFMKGTFDKLDIRPNYAHAGRFKSAVESYTRSGMSPESRESLRSLLDEQFAIYVDSVATERGLTSDDVRDLIDRGPFTAEEAVEAGLVDTLVYDAEADTMAAADIADDAPTMSFSQYVDRLSPPRTGPRIALIAAAGEISAGRSRYEPNEGHVLGSETIIEALEEARTRSSIKAVVLRIDSPGGEMPASDDIWREVARLTATKPVVVSMSDLAASGGYYIATHATRIVAQPTTLTGSVGVFGGKLNVLGLYRKLGLNIESVSIGRHAEMMSPYTDFDAEEAKLYKDQLDDAYRVFLERVSDGRGISVDQADSIGQGRVWGGLRAFDNGLVDTLGGFETAFDLALSQAGLSKARGYRVEVLPKVEHSWIERVVEGWIGDDEPFTPGIPLPSLGRVPRVVRAWIAAAHHSSARRGFALMPFSVEIR